MHFLNYYKKNQSYSILEENISKPFQKFLNQSFSALIFIVIITMPISVGLSSFSLILLSIVWFLIFIGEKHVPKRKDLIIYFFIISIFIIKISGLLYSSNLKSAFFNIEKSLALFAFPTIFFFINQNRLPKRKMVMLTFVGTILLLTLYCYIRIFANIIFFQENAFINLNMFYRDALIQFLKIHPIYFAFYIVFSMLILIDLLGRNLRRYSRLRIGVSIIVILHFAIFVGLLAARMSIIAIIITIVFYIFYHFIKQKKFGKLFMGLSGTVILFSLLIFYIPGISKRFYEILETPWVPPVGLGHNSTNLRIAQWMCSFEVIESNWLWGVGTGDGQDGLNNCYEMSGFSDVLYKLNYNSHNQFLQTWLDNGLLAFLCLLGILLFSLCRGLKNNNTLLLFFTIFVFLSFLTENYLSAQKGIFFFGFFLSFLIIKDKDESH